MNIKILELLASKICHDLISPIGAVNNGIEFLEEMGADALEDAKELIGMSAHQASAKLQAYRMAYGAGGADSNHKPADVFAYIQALIGESGKIALKYDTPAFEVFRGEDGHFPHGYCKVLTALLIQMLDTLPKGGEIEIMPADADGQATTITARGERAAFKDGVGDALLLSIPEHELHTKHIHAHVCGLLAQNYGFSMTHKADTPDYVTLKLSRTA